MTSLLGWGLSNSVCPNWIHCVLCKAVSSALSDQYYQTHPCAEVQNLHCSDPDSLTSAAFTSWGTESSESTFLWKLSSFLHPLYQYDQTSVFHENCKNCLLIDLSHIVFYFLMLSLSSYWRDSPKIFILKPSILHYGHGMEYLNLNQGPLPTSISPSFIPCSSASAVVSGPIWDWANEHGYHKHFVNSKRFWMPNKEKI